jgi:diguanylate cyclase (GGDEF)-like protein
MRRVFSRFSLLARFSALSLVVMLLIGMVLARFLQDRVEDRAIANAKQQAQTIIQTAVRDHIAPNDWNGVLSEERLNDIDDALELKQLDELDVERVKLFNAEGTLIYSGDRTQLGLRSGPSVVKALKGEVTSSLDLGTDDSGTGHRTVEVYLPVMGDAGVVDGAAEIYFNYEAAATATERDVRFLYLTMLVGFGVLWLVLFRIVAGASRALRRQRDEMTHQARHDALTELANRAALQERGAAALASDQKRVRGLMLIDLDHFKEVNDTLGHDRGDMLLREVARRLTPLSGPDDVLTRLGGDEFALLVVGCDDDPVLRDRADAVRRALAKPIDLGTVSIRVDGTVGIALCPEHGDTVDTLLKHADVAMYRAKAISERSGVYDPGQDPHTEARLVLASQLPDAIERGELVVHYQPIVAAAGAAVRAVEALVRWNHPTRGLLAPGEFLPLAERTGAIGPLTVFVIREAVQQAHRWDQQGLGIGVACNLASASASDDSLPAMVAATLAQWPLPSGRLTLELSEDTVINDPLRVGSVLERLHALGVRISLDDFGTGQSSLAYLRKLPLDELKIDRSFVMALEERTDISVVDAMIALARSFGLLTVAEGVEDELTAQSLARLGCDLLQGFHYSRPLPADELERWLAAHSELPLEPLDRAPLDSDR